MLRQTAISLNCTFFRVLDHWFTASQWARKVNKVQAKKLVKSNKSKKISGSFKLFSSSKINFWSFLKLQKMEFGQKNSWNQINQFHEKIIWLNSILCYFKNGQKLFFELSFMKFFLIYLISRVFFQDFFFNFLAHCAPCWWKFFWNWSFTRFLK